MVQRQDYDAGAPANFLGTRGLGAEGDRWGLAAPVLDAVVLGWLDRVEAVLLGAHHHVDRLRSDRLLSALHVVLDSAQPTAPNS